MMTVVNLKKTGINNKRKYCLVILAGALIVNLIFCAHSFRRSSSLERSKEWQNFRTDYKHRFLRDPPDSLQKWLVYAKSMNCETRDFYNAIHNDLAPFRNATNLPTLGELLQKSGSYSNHRIEFSLRNHKLTAVFVHKPGATLMHRMEGLYITWAYRWLLRPLTRHQPPIHTKFVVSLHDAPMSPLNARAPIFSASRLSHHTDDHYTKKKNQLFETDNDELSRDHMRKLFQSKGNLNENGTSVKNDLLIPYYFSIGLLARGFWFWPFYTYGRNWIDRINTGTLNRVQIEKQTFHLRFIHLSNGVFV
jgi:hypothetical protein